MGKRNRIECASGNVLSEVDGGKLMAVSLSGNVDGGTRTWAELCRSLTTRQVHQVERGLVKHGAGVLAYDVCGHTVVAYVRCAAPADEAAERLLDEADEALRRERNRELVDVCRALGARRVEA